MNQELKERWLQALRSGAYTQIRERLHNVNGFDALGVLGDLLVHDGVLQWWVTGPEDCVLVPHPDGPTIRNECGPWWDSVPEEVSGIPMQQQEHLMCMNDDGHASFDDIANWIEENL